MRRNTVSGLRKQRRHTTRVVRAVSTDGSGCQSERLGLSVQTARTVSTNGFGLSVRTARTVGPNGSDCKHEQRKHNASTSAPAVSVPERQRFCSENLNYSALFESKNIYKYNKECLHDTFFL